MKFFYQNIHFWKSGDVRKHKTKAICLVVAGLIFLMGCGKKGPPVPPAHVSPPMVENMDVRLEENIAVLTWPVPDIVPKGTEPDASGGVAGFYVYYIKTAVGGEYRCPNCPVQLDRIAEVKIEGSRASAVFEMPLEKGFHHTFAVSCYMETGEEGEQSAAVTRTY